jgi:hypothetical protein
MGDGISLQIAITMRTETAIEQLHILNRPRQCEPIRQRKPPSG